MNILYVNMKAIIATLNYWNIVYLTDLKKNYEAWFISCLKHFSILELHSVNLHLKCKL